jgi:hypothetical protein
MKSSTVRLINGSSSSKHEISELITSVLKLGKLLPTQFASIPYLI